jgi:hypothetical protein
VVKFGYSKNTQLAGAGIQTAALAFGGSNGPTLSGAQKNIMVQVGQMEEV